MLGSAAVKPIATSTEQEIVASIERLYPRLFRFARFCLEPGEAEDATASALERIWRMRGRYRSERGSIDAWLYTVGANAIRDEARRARRKPRTVAIDDLELASAPAVETGQLAEVREAIARLSFEDAELIALRFALELSNEEIGRVVGRSTGATATALHRALRRLRRLLEEDSKHD
jgi:RNA polymerase sigma-70 factor, ECF subfamily